MTLTDIVTEVEGQEFAIRVNFASGFGTFVENVRNENAVRELLGLCSDASARAKILERVTTLAGRPTDDRYENPADAALAVYCLVLYWMGSPLARQISSYLRTLPRCWWALAVATRILSPKRIAASPIRSSRANFAGVITPVYWSNRSSTATTQRATFAGAVGAKPYFAPIKMCSAEETWTYLSFPTCRHASLQVKPTLAHGRPSIWAWNGLGFSVQAFRLRKAITHVPI